MAEHLAELHSGPAHHSELHLGFHFGARCVAEHSESLAAAGASRQNFVAGEVWVLIQDDARPQAPNTSVHAALAIARLPLRGHPLRRAGARLRGVVNA